jgi:tripeptide aminopeptidase
MSATTPHVDLAAAEERLMRFLAVDGVSGEEAAIAELISQELKGIGVPENAIRFDSAHERIPMATQTGNLVVTLPGTRDGDRLLFATHMDTIPLCAGAKPMRSGDRIAGDGTTGLGADNRTGCAVLVTLVETL